MNRNRLRTLAAMIITNARNLCVGGNG